MAFSILAMVAAVRAIPLQYGLHEESLRFCLEVLVWDNDLAGAEFEIERIGGAPTSYDLGEAMRAVLLSVTEGEDRTLKYPATLHQTDLVVLHKVDLLRIESHL